MALPIVFLLSGQGSHYRGMGRALFDAEPVFRDRMFWADREARAAIGGSLVEHLYGPEDKGAFDRLLITHPALYAVEIALARTLESWGVRPDLLLGASLGEYTAMALAGAVDPGRMLRLLIAQAAGFERAASPGGMLAVFAPPALARDETDLFAEVEIAAENFHEHFVVAGPPERLDALAARLTARDVPSHRLEVAFAFHSRFIADARAAFDTGASEIEIGEAEVPIVSCVDGRRRSRVSREHLWRIVREPILFARTVHELEREGPHLYIDVGPSGTLATFVRHLLGKRSASRAVPLLTPMRTEVSAIRRRLADAGILI